MPPDFADYNDDDADDLISRSQLKRDAENAQAWGERLIKLNPEQLATLNLSDNLHEAILLAQRISSNGALRRQKQYIGKLMREEDLAPIEAQFAQWDNHSRLETARLHELERWRERLITADAALGELMQAYNNVDVQHVRNLVRNARKEQAANKPPKAARELFQYLRHLEKNDASSLSF